MKRWRIDPWLYGNYSFASYLNILTRKRLYILSFLKDSGKRSERSWKTGAPAGDTILNHGYPVALAGYFQERVGTLLHFMPKLHLPPLACRGTFCGFSARTYLYRIFKLKEGCTPAEWREKMAENVAFTFYL